MRISALLMVTLVVSVLLAGCGGQETPVEKAEEEGSVEETTVEETTIEETNSRAEATVEETNAPAETATSEPVPEPIAEPARDAIEPQAKEVPVSAPSEEAIREQAQTEEGINVTQTAAPDPATVGRPLTFTVTVTNNSFPQHVGYKDFLPPSMTLVSATPSEGFCGMPHHGGNMFDCTLGVIPNGGSVTVEIVAIPTVPGTMTNTAQAGGGFAPVSSVPASVTVNP